MMTADGIHVKATQFSLIEGYLNRIEHLFDVHVLITKDDASRSGTRSGSYKLSAKTHVPSDSAQESLQKAQSYVFSLLAEGSDREQVTRTFPEEQFKMVQEKQDEIEKNSQAILDINVNKCEICIFGRSESVLQANDVIERMVVVKQSHVSSVRDVRARGGFSGVTQEDLETGDIFSNSRSWEKWENSEEMCENETPCACRRKDDDYSSLQTDCAPGETRYSKLIDTAVECSNESVELPLKQKCFERENSVICDSDLADANSQCDLEVQNLSKCLSSQSSCSTSSTDDIVDKPVIKDRTNIEFALKLGYSEEQISSVLKKLGPNTGKNEILSELITIKSTESSDSDSEDSTLECQSESFRMDFGDFERLEKEGSTSGLRPVVIDGSNVAMSHGNKEIFSCKGIQLAVDWFRERDHDAITVFVPQWRKETSRPDAKITDQDILLKLEREKILVFTPARRIGGKRVVCYDDRYILNLAVETGAIIVSNDHYRDLVTEKPEYRKVVEERLLMYSFVNDRFMPPDDPLGRHGPNLDNFLSKEPKQQEPLPPPCPYGSKKCTYGNKCKFYHPERGNNPHRSVTDKLAEQTRQKLQEIRDREKGVCGEKKKQPLSRKSSGGPKMALQRTRSLVPTALPSDLISAVPSNLRHSATDLNAITDDFSKKVDMREKEKLKAYKKRLEEAELEEKRQEDRKRKEEELRKCHLHTADNQVSRSSSPLQRKSPSPKPKIQEQFLISGHLMLAKKLSDEAGDSSSGDDHHFTRSPPHGRSPLTISHPQTNQHQPLANHLSLTLGNNLRPHQNLSMQKSTPLPVEFQQQKQPQNMHKKLSRQFSLQGAHDPRLSQQRPQMMREQHNPHNYLPQQNVQAHYSQGQYGMNPHQVCYPPMHYPPPMEESKFQSPANRNDSPRTRLLSQRLPHSGEVFQHGRPYLGIPEGNEHSTLARMQSAPETQHIKDHHQPQKTMRHMMRQNSSSDTQLHLIGDQISVDYCLFPGPNEVFHSNSSQSNLTGEIPCYHSSMEREATEPPFASSHRAQHQSGETKWTFDPVFGLDRNSFSSNIVPKGGIDAFESDYPPTEIHQRGQDPWANSQNQNYALQAKLQMRSPGHNQQVTPPQRQAISQKRSLSRTESTGFTSHQPVEHTSMSVPAFHTNDLGLGNFGVVGHEQKSNAQPDTNLNYGHFAVGPNVTHIPSSVSDLHSLSCASAVADDAPIHPTDKRYNLYYHLCGLFAEHKVRAVMNQHPEETNPQELCAYIIGAK